MSSLRKIEKKHGYLEYQIPEMQQEKEQRSVYSSQKQYDPPKTRAQLRQSSKSRSKKSGDRNNSKHEPEFYQLPPKFKARPSTKKQTISMRNDEHSHSRHSLPKIQAKQTGKQQKINRKSQNSDWIQQKTTNGTICNYPQYQIEDEQQHNKNVKISNITINETFQSVPNIMETINMVEWFSKTKELLQQLQTVYLGQFQKKEDQSMGEND